MSASKSPGKFPARLHVLLARDSSLGLIIRRGPSKSVSTIGWNRDRDTFKLGQWFRGRIHERRSDLSPDGQHFIYFAMNGRWHTKAKGSWTAISRSPYLKAITLLAKGDCWHGGGLFLTDRTYWLNDGYGHESQLSARSIERNSQYEPSARFGGECLNVYYNRLMRDDWTMSPQEFSDHTLFEKKLPKSWVLRKLAFAETNAPPGHGCYWDAHELKHESSGELLVFPDWEWAEWDRGRLVWATSGQLRTAQLGRGKLMHEKLLHDFNEMTFERRVAPY